MSNTYMQNNLPTMIVKQIKEMKHIMVREV